MTHQHQHHQQQHYTYDHSPPAFASTSSVSLDLPGVVVASTSSSSSAAGGWALPSLPRGGGEGEEGGIGFFTSNHEPSGGGYSASSTTGAYSALPEFGEGAGEDGASRTAAAAGVGRPRKRTKTMSDAGGGGGESSGTEASSSTAKRKAGTGGKVVKGKGKKKDLAVGGAEEEEGSQVSDATTTGVKKGKVVKPRKNPGDKKKKAGRACAACQKAHLTCDDARPCARCIKKGCPESCHDGTRKKAKYLMEIPDELLERGRHPPTSAPPVDAFQMQEEMPLPAEGAASESPADILQDPTHNPAPFSFDALPYYDSHTFGGGTTNEFGSEAANLEYAILSSMLNGNGFAVDNYGDPSSTSNGVKGDGNTMLINSPLMGAGPLNHLGAGAGTSNGASTSNSGGGFTLSSFRPGASTATSPAGAFALSSLFPAEEQGGGTNGVGGGGGVGDLFGGAAGGGGGGGEEQFGPTPAAAAASTSTAINGGMMTGEQAYRSVTKPYPYAQSYHYLVKHLKERFEKNDILRIIRALATFRPSLIALQMPLTEEDEIFVERTFQRTLVELNKLISFSGTPTVVWRRTGEICLVGTEFCLLTGWSRDELLGKKYIFELLDTVSVVDLYEAFAKHAFESTSSSVTMQCVVLGPTGRPVPCAFCFSIRRDLFSCPSLVVGSFLPILT